MIDDLPEDAPAPRLCHLIKWRNFDGYGFNLHAERSKPGQFIGKIDDASPAQLAGLCEGDRIIEVNGVNINNENHCQVVERIKSNQNETQLLVVDQDTDLWYKEHEIVVKSNQANVVYIKTPVPKPESMAPVACATSNADSANFGAQQDESTNNTQAAASPNLNTEQQQQQQQQQPPPDIDATENALTVGSTSDTTSDFNDDSIEAQVVASKPKSTSPAQPPPAAETTTIPLSAHQDRSKSPLPPPMSPDSGKGDEEPSGANLGFTSSRDESVVVVEAEINRQSLTSSVVSKHEAEDEDDDDDEQHSYNQHQQQDHHQHQHQNESCQIQNQNQNWKHQQDYTNNNLDSKTDDQSPVDSLAEECQVNAKNEIDGSRELNSRISTSTRRSGSADSGKSDSQGSINDLLDDTKLESKQNDFCGLNKGPLGNQAQDQLCKLAKPVVDPSLAMKLNNKDNSNVVEDVKLQQVSADQQEQNENQDLLSKTKVQQRQINNNNNSLYDNLNLNMTAKEMRQLISRRKKVDPKKAQINIRQKYEIIQKM